MSAKWEKADPIGDWLDSVTQGNDTLKAAADVLTTLAETANDAGQVLGLVDAFLGTDPIGLAMSTVGRVLGAFLNDLEGVDVYALPLLPHSWSDLLHPYTTSNAMVDVASSLTDMMDPNRPVFSAGSAFASATFLVGADNWMDFRKLLKILDTLFSADQGGKWARLADLRYQFDKHKLQPVPRAARGSQGETWDWMRTNWTELIPPVGNLIHALRDLAESLLGVVNGVGNMLSDLADVIRERASYLRQIAEELAKLLSFLAALRKLAPYGSWLFLTSADGGTDKYLMDLTNAGNQPPYKLVAGVTLFTATPNPAAFYEIIKRVFGVQAQNAEQLALQIQAV